MSVSAGRPSSRLQRSRKLPQKKSLTGTRSASRWCSAASMRASFAPQFAVRFTSFPPDQSRWKTSSMSAHHSSVPRLASGALHGLHDGPPLLGLRILRHLRHVGLVVRADVLEVREELAVPVEDGVVADVALRDLRQHLRPHAARGSACTRRASPGLTPMSCPYRSMWFLLRAVTPNPQERSSGKRSRLRPGARGGGSVRQDAVLLTTGAGRTCRRPPW